MYSTVFRILVFDGCMKRGREMVLRACAYMFVKSIRFQFFFPLYFQLAA